MDTVKCPYCFEECDIEREDDRFTTQDGTDELECSHCEKTFLVNTEIVFEYTGDKCPCKNGEEHNYQPISGCPREYFEGKDRCSYCNEMRDNYTPEKRKEVMDNYIKSLRK